MLFVPSASYWGELPCAEPARSLPHPDAADRRSRAGPFGDRRLARQRQRQTVAVAARRRRSAAAAEPGAPIPEGSRDAEVLRGRDLHIAGDRASDSVPSNPEKHRLRPQRQRRHLRHDLSARRASAGAARPPAVMPAPPSQVPMPSTACDGSCEGHVYTVLTPRASSRVACSRIRRVLDQPDAAPRVPHRCYAFNGTPPASCAPAAAPATVQGVWQRAVLLPAALRAGPRPVRARHPGDRRRRQPHHAGTGNIEDRVLCPLAPAHVR